MGSLSDISTNQPHPIKSYADSDPTVQKARATSGTIFPLGIFSIRNL